MEGKAHWIFSAKECPEFAPDVVIVDISRVTPAPKEGWSYDGVVFTPPPGPGAEELRARRDGLLAASDWLIQRHRDQLDSELPTSLTTASYESWIAYRQALRDVPTQPGFPDEVGWPALPASG